jgi:hypothetical protein
MPTPHPGAVVLRPARPDDGDALVRLAALDSARPLTGPALVATQNGAIVAALCLSTGRAVADPFLPTAHLVALLRQAASRFQATVAPRRRILPRLAPRPG